MKAWMALVGGVGALMVGCGSGEPAGQGDQALMDPHCAAMQEQAPDKFSVRFTTSAGEFVVEVDRDLAPRGADRFYNLVRHGFYDDQRFFRVLPGFVVQWGMSGDPKLNEIWHNAAIPDDPVKGSNTPGTITFAKTADPNSRTTQLFINLGDNSRSLDGQGFAPFGRVAQGMEVVRAIHSEYGQRPDQQQIGIHGNEYLKAKFPALDYIETARIIE